MDIFTCLIGCQLTGVARCDAAKGKLKSDKCTARVHTDTSTGVVVKRVGEHTHASDAAHVEEQGCECCEGCECICFAFSLK